MESNKKYQYIKEMFLPQHRSHRKKYLSEKKVDGILQTIDYINNSVGFIGGNISLNQNKNKQRTQKYSVWIAKEIKNDINLLKKKKEFLLIIDWAIETKCNLFNYTFNQAFELQKDWHLLQFKKHSIEKIKIPNIDKKRILYYSEDKKYFIYLLKAKDLSHEGNNMKNCVGGQRYKKKEMSNKSIFLSLRDINNNSHVTVEIDTNKSTVIQLLGKTNTNPKLEYLEKMLEFILFYTGFKNISNNKTLKMMNLTNGMLI